jgi:methionyl-tRNA formyltransferase
MFENIENGCIVTADKSRGIQVKCNNSLLKLELLQMEGKKILDWKSFMNGFRELSNQKFQ